ncbi:hypothetical protein KIH39_17575 [Telmatocola sphagniphila]|jgi:hypothetical protein|uniref:Uncharacterized protein n=1 Tax=Telmatocola sphagniphila TaxID=1123043 RepID=A0A8E6ETX1_9BACT|nr:hypothetical protein [Telmatocola sphagniphila]QVL30655.1 hypothetical protein KIH39_17575 [Telmatocola sphagniphila]
MRRIIALAFAVIILAALSSPASARQDAKGDKGENKGANKVEAGMVPTYVGPAPTGSEDNKLMPVPSIALAAIAAILIVGSLCIPIRREESSDD